MCGALPCINDAQRACGLIATIQEEFIYNNRFGLTEQPQFAVEMLAPISGDYGDGDEIGAVLSWGSRASLSYHSPKPPNVNIL